MFPIRIKACSESDLRMLGNLARNIQRVLPVTQADIDAAAALGKGWVVWKVVEVNDPIDNLRGGTQLVIKQNSVQPGQNVRRVLIVSGPGGETVVIGPGMSPLLLPDAIANSLSYVKAFGGTEQNGTPTPDTPVDIVSNNGALKFTANEANYTADNVTLGYWIRNNNGQPESSPANFYTAMMPVKPDVSYVCFGRNKETDVISGYNRIAWYDANGVWIRNSTYTQNQPGIDVAPSNAAFARFHCNINGTDVTQELVDSYNWVFQQGTAEVPYTPYSPTKVYTDGPIETIAIKDDQSATVSTATCEDLLSVGTYTDEQEIISGVVTKKVGIKVFDGTENFSTVNNTFRYGLTGLPMNNKVICNYFDGNVAPSISTSNQPDLTIKGNVSNNNTVYFKYAAKTTVEDFQQWLADQAAAGTPVIVLYPLATPTTESVTGQTLQVQGGDNTLEITQASLTGLELEAEYTKVA